MGGVARHQLSREVDLKKNVGRKRDRFGTQKCPKCPKILKNTGNAVDLGFDHFVLHVSLTPDVIKWAPGPKNKPETRKNKNKGENNKRNRKF